MGDCTHYYHHCCTVVWWFPGGDNDWKQQQQQQQLSQPVMITVTVKLLDCGGGKLSFLSLSLSLSFFSLTVPLYLRRLLLFFCNRLLCILLSLSSLISSVCTHSQWKGKKSLFSLSLQVYFFKCRLLYKHAAWIDTRANTEKLAEGMLLWKNWLTHLVVVHSEHSLAATFSAFFCQFALLKSVFKKVPF